MIKGFPTRIKCSDYSFEFCFLERSLLRYTFPLAVVTNKFRGICCLNKSLPTSSAVSLLTIGRDNLNFSIKSFLVTPSFANCKTFSTSPLSKFDGNDVINSYTLVDVNVMYNFSLIAHMVFPLYRS